MLKRLPEDIKSILEGLSSDYTVENYSSQYMGWNVDVISSSRRFNLVKEWNQVFISEVIDKQTVNVWPMKGQTKDLEIDKVAEVINDLTA